MRILLLSNVSWKSFCFLSSSTDFSFAGNIGWEVWNLSMSTICSATISRVPWKLECSSTTSWRRLQKAPASWLEMSRKCYHFFCTALTNICIVVLCPFNVVEHRHENDTFIKRFWSLPVEIFLKMSVELNSKIEGFTAADNLLRINVVRDMTSSNNVSSRPSFFCDWSCCKNLCQLTCCVDVFDLNHRIQAVIKSIQINTVFARYMTHCKTSSVVYLIYHSFVVFGDVSWNLRAEESSVRKYQINVSKWFLMF